MDTFPERLNWCIEQTGLGRPEFANRAGVGTSALAKWLAGKLTPKSEQLLAIARIAEVPMEWLLSGEGLPASSQAYNKMLSRFKEIGGIYHPSDIEAQEGLMDVLTDATAPLAASMSKRTEITPPEFGRDKYRRVRVVGWAHAGEAYNYEELPEHWCDSLLTDCRDPEAFGVRLEGDSMADDFHEDDRLVVMPSEQVHSGCFAIGRFTNGGVFFRRFEMMGDKVRLVPSNDRYEATTHDRSEFSWIYPIWESRRQLWKR